MIAQLSRVLASAARWLAATATLALEVLGLGWCVTWFTLRLLTFPFAILEAGTRPGTRRRSSRPTTARRDL